MKIHWICRGYHHGERVDQVCNYTYICFELKIKVIKINNFKNNNHRTIIILLLIIMINNYLK
jgi:hypothetical protein